MKRQYRICAKDDGDYESDVLFVSDHRDEAEAHLNLVQEDPPYDREWIEVREVGPWVRLQVVSPEAEEPA